MALRPKRERTGVQTLKILGLSSFRPSEFANRKLKPSAGYAAGSRVDLLFHEWLKQKRCKLTGTVSRAPVHLTDSHLFLCLRRLS